MQWEDGSQESSAQPDPDGPALISGTQAPASDLQPFRAGDVPDAHHIFATSIVCRAFAAAFCTSFLQRGVIGV